MEHHDVQWSEWLKEGTCIAKHFGGYLEAAVPAQSQRRLSSCCCSSGLICLYITSTCRERLELAVVKAQSSHDCTILHKQGGARVPSKGRQRPFPLYIKRLNNKRPRKVRLCLLCFPWPHIPDWKAMSSFGPIQWPKCSTFVKGLVTACGAHHCQASLNHEGGRRARRVWISATNAHAGSYPFLAHSAPLSQSYISCTAGMGPRRLRGQQGAYTEVREQYFPSSWSGHLTVIASSPLHAA